MNPQSDSDKVNWLVSSIPWVMAIALSLMGGAVRYLDHVNRNNLAFNLARFAIELFISGFTGIVAFMLCDFAELSWSITAAICAISGHMGTRAWFLAEKTMLLPFLRRFGYENSEERTGRKKITTHHEARPKTRKKAEDGRPKESSNEDT